MGELENVENGRMAKQENGKTGGRVKMEYLYVKGGSILELEQK